MSAVGYLTARCCARRNLGIPNRLTPPGCSEPEWPWMHPASSLLSGECYPGTVTAMRFVPLLVAFSVEFLRAYPYAAVCPVCSNPVGADSMAVVPGRPVQVCSEACSTRLDSDVP